MTSLSNPVERNLCKYLAWPVDETVEDLSRERNSRYAHNQAGCCCASRRHTLAVREGYEELNAYCVDDDALTKEPAWQKKSN